LKVEPDERGGFQLQMRNFLDAINGVAKAVNNADQAVELMEMIDGIYNSSDLGREVPITGK
jgi:predicted dehydrogenase